SSGELPRVGTADTEYDPDWSLARSRVDEQLALEEEMLREIGAMDLLELLSAERQLLSDDRLTAEIVLAPQAKNSPGNEALADLSQRLFLAMRQSPNEPILRQGLVLLGYRVLLSHLLGAQSKWIRAVITCEGGETSHTAIAARWLGIPMVTGFKPSDLEEMAACDNLVVDGQEGTVQVEQRTGPMPTPIGQVSPAVAPTQQQMLANADSLEMVAAAMAAGASGIGLVRSEVLFIGSGMPDEEEQYRQVSVLLAHAGDKPVTIRVANLGATSLQREQITQRGTAILLRNYTILQTQFRALLRASRGHRLQILLPMVRTWQEFRTARSYFLEEKRALEGYLDAAIDVQLGAALETPALVWQLDEVLEDADFISIGSNDLGALLFAQSREGAFVLDTRIGLQPAFWRCIARVAAVANSYQKPLIACGVLAGQWPEALLLHGLGIAHSVSVDRIHLIANLLSGWSEEKSRHLVDEVLLCRSSSELVDRCRAEGIRVRPEA
ncbi:MAG: putative PEP-binding protein, partial [Anaerolineae bacterium]